MGRRRGKKKKPELVCNFKARCRHFAKGKKSVEKSAMDLSTLCGVDIAMVVFPPDGGATATAWSSSRQQVLPGLMASFFAACSGKKTYTVSDVLKDESGEDVKSDRAGLVAKIGAGESSLTESSSVGDRAGFDHRAEFVEDGLVAKPPRGLDQEKSQMSATNFDCYADLPSFDVEASLGSMDLVSEEYVDWAGPVVSGMSLDLGETSFVGDRAGFVEDGLVATPPRVLDQEMWQMSATNFDCYADLPSFDDGVTSLGSLDFVSEEYVDWAGPMSSIGGVSGTSLDVGETSSVVGWAGFGEGEIDQWAGFDLPGGLVATPTRDQEMSQLWATNLDCLADPSSFDVETSLGSFEFEDESVVSQAAKWFLNDEQNGDRFLSSVLGF